MELTLAGFRTITRGREFSTARKVRCDGKKITFNRAAAEAFGLTSAFGADVHFNMDGGILLHVIDTEEEKSRSTMTFSNSFNKHASLRSKAIQVSRLMKNLPHDRAEAIRKAESLNVEPTVVRDSEGKQIPGNWLAVSA